MDKNKIVKYAELYDARYKKEDSIVEIEMKQLLTRQKYLHRNEFIKIGLWKSKRPKKYYESDQNDESTVKEVTEFSFRTKNERLRIESLFMLRGVNYPLATVILHFADPDQYPILDFRALWSLGIYQPKSYTFKFWIEYCMIMRSISKELDLPIRIIDKALWQYSKNNQKVQ